MSERSRLSVRPRHVAVALVTGLLLVGSAGCASQTVTKWGSEAKANFVDGCTTSRQVVDGAVKETAIASKSACECVYTAMEKTYRMEWSELKDYEDQVADAKDGEAPEMPAKMKKAITKCSSDSSSSDASDSSDSTTTTTSAE